MKTKTLTAALITIATLTAFSCFAEECGKRLTDTQIEKIIASIELVTENLSQHQEAILKEAVNLSVASAFDKADRSLSEESLISSVQQSAGYVVTSLDQALTLSHLKSVMVDQRDKIAVEKFLSIVAARVRKSSQSAHERVSQLLPRISTPGIAVDTAKLRDNLALTTKAFESCTPPAPSKPRSN